MKYIKNTLDFHVEKPTVISLGKFDGIHRGHELLMEKLAHRQASHDTARSNREYVPMQTMW